MEGAVLVVAATDGSMPQTKEHMLLAKQVDEILSAERSNIECTTVMLVINSITTGMKVM